MTNTITLPRSVLEQALNALEMMGVPSPLVFLPDEIKSWQTVQAELSAALEQPQVEQEPVTARHRFRNPQRGTPDWSVWQPCKVEKKRPVWENDSQGFEVEYQALYTHPQPKREPLTDEQIIDIAHEVPVDEISVHEDTWHIRFVRAIERAHKIGGEA